MESLIGREIGHYRITEQIGEGGMAVVYKAHQHSLERDVAIKVLTGPLATDEEFVTRFRREAMAAGALGHPNILTVHDAGTTEDGLHYIVMEYAPGGTLGDLLKRGPLTVRRACQIAAQIADALQVAHENGIVHRDLKPNNILFARDGRPLLMDFGVALIGKDTRLTRTGVAIGTPEYMSPEQAQGFGIDRRSDVYSLGILLYEMISGDVPFTSDTQLSTLYQHVHRPVPPLRERGAKVPDWMEQIIGRALEKDPEMRFQTAGDFATALRTGGMKMVVPPKISERQRRQRDLKARRQRAAVQRVSRGSVGSWMFGIIVAIGVVAGGTYGLFFKADPWWNLIQQWDLWANLGGPFASAQGQDSLARGTPTPDAPQQTATAVGVIIATSDARTTATARASRTAAVRTATADAARVATADARETEVAQAVASATEGARIASITSAAMTAAAQTSTAQAATAEAQAARTAAARATRTARAMATLTSRTRATQTAQALARPTSTPTSPTSTPSPTPSPTASRTPSRTATSTATPTPQVAGVFYAWEDERAWERGTEPYGTFTMSGEQVYSGAYAGKLEYSFPSRGNDFVVFESEISLGGEPRYLGIWVYGDASGYFLNAWVKDAEGEVFQTTFGQVNHTGWQMMTASLEPGQPWPWDHIRGQGSGQLDYPVSFQGLVLDDVPDSAAGQGVIYVDDLSAWASLDDVPGMATTATPVSGQATVESTETPLAAASPSGMIAFPLFNPEYEKYDVYVQSLSTGERWLVMEQARQPSFGPGRRLALNGDAMGNDAIVAVNYDGSDPQRISIHPEDAHPTWSPDGTRILFDSPLGVNKEVPLLYTHEDLSASAEPSTVRYGLSHDLRGQYPTWLGDGRIVFNGCNYWSNGSLCGLYLIGGLNPAQEPLRLTTDAADTAPSGYVSRITYMSRVDGNWEVYIMNDDGSGKRNLTRSPGNDGLPAWSPDGEWIAFVTDRSGQWAIWAMSPDGTQASELFPLGGGFGSDGYDFSSERISWTS